MNSKATTYTAEDLAVEVLEDSRSFKCLEREWDELYCESPGATPFQSWAWLYSWWESYGEEGSLRVITVRASGGLLVGILPLMVDNRRGLTKLQFVGTGVTDHLDALVREGWREPLAECFKRALWRMKSWQVADLRDLSPRAAAWSVFEGWSGPRLCLFQENCPVTHLRPWEELLASLSKNQRKMARRSLRRAEEDGLRNELAQPHDTERAARTLLRLHRESWRGRGIAAEHLSARFEALLQSAARRMTERGLAAISERRRDDEVSVSVFLVLANDFVGAYLAGASSEALKRYQYSSLYIHDAVQLGLERGSKQLSHLRGEEPYKLVWSSRVSPNHRLILGRGHGRWTLYAGYHALRARVGAYAGSEEAPAPLRRANSAYLDLRSQAARRLEGVLRWWRNI